MIYTPFIEINQKPPKQNLHLKTLIGGTILLLISRNYSIDSTRRCKNQVQKSHEYIRDTVILMKEVTVLP